MTKPKTPRPKTESLPDVIHIIEAEGESDFRLIEAAAEETPTLKRFTMTAYTGGKLFLANYPFPVVVDLSGLRISAKSRPILRDHDSSKIVGHTESIEIGAGSIKLAGVISAANEFAREVAESSTNGFPWQASIGAQSEKIAFIDEGEHVEVNGRKLTGPLYVARRAVLREVSFVALGADDQTNAKVAAQSSSPFGANDMEFEAWLKALGFQAEDLDETQTVGLQAVYDREQAGRTEVPPTELVATVPPTTTVPEPIVPPVDPIDELRAKWAAERRRIQKITEICAGQHPGIEAQAIEEGWEETKTELAVLRASRPKAPAVGSSTPPLTAKTLEAAVCLSVGISGDSLVREFGERTLDAARPLRHMGLKELVAECARMEGRQIPRVFGDGQETIRAGFSTLSLPGILESVMNRTMLAAYEASPIAAFELCSIGSVSDFKEVSRYRLLGTGGFEKVAPDGELKHGKLSQQEYKNRADTYGQILMLTRKDVINDDLNAFLDITRQMGRSGAESIDDLFFTLLLSNPDNFFSVGNGNYQAGAETAFSADALTTAKTLFRKQKAGPGSKAKDKKPINVRPELLVVPVELETEAELLMGSAQLMIDAMGSPTRIPVDNPHRNKYRVVSMPHLSDSYYAGSSAKAWYLFANPQVLPAFELVFLNGRRVPVIERVEAPPDTLGMGFRGYLDVGCAEQDFRGGVKLKGEA